MRIHVILCYVGYVLLLNAIFLLIAAAISFINSETAVFPLLYSAIICILFGAFPLVFVPYTRIISGKEGIIVVVCCWLFSCVIGMLPYLLWGGEFTAINAWFESVSGFTTTGSSILSDVEKLPNGLLFWRASTQLIGGMGIIIFVLSILPYMGIAGMVLYRTERSQTSVDKFSFNTRRVAQILMKVYGSLTILEIVLLTICGMTFFDAVCHSFATIATGGFSTKNSSIGYYDSVGIETVIIIFMVLSGVNFGLLYAILTGSIRKLWQSSALKYYLAALLIGVILTTVSLYGEQFRTWGSSLRYSAFQVISIGTSTGFATIDTNVWSSLAKVLIIFFALQCACAGSTSGGIKVDRLVVLVKGVVKNVRRTLHPSAVIPVSIDGTGISQTALEMSLLYISLYLLVAFISTVILAALGVDGLTAFSGSVATMGNVGPGLGAVGTVLNYGHIPGLGKFVLSMDMLLGRLEILVFIIFVFPETWKRLR